MFLMCTIRLPGCRVERSADERAEIMRVAIVHFTGPPAVGGIEGIIAAQVDTLAAMGVQVRLLVGRGDALWRAETIVIPTLHPAEATVAAERARLNSTFPGYDHPL